MASFIWIESKEQMKAFTSKILPDVWRDGDGLKYAIAKGNIIEGIEAKV